MTIAQSRKSLVTLFSAFTAKTNQSKTEIMNKPQSSSQEEQDNGH
jgi:hypothetical protein